MSDRSRMARQIPLDLGAAPALGREHLVESACNRDALSAIERWPDWDGPALLLLGPVGSGKTHLAHIFAAHAGAVFLDPDRLNDRQDTDLERAGTFVLEDADRTTPDETAFFHLLNRIRETGSSLLMTARNWPKFWPLKLPDLRSRLVAISAVELHEPDDALLSTVLVKLFADRQLIPDPSVVAYLTKRMERSIAAAVEVVDAIDHEALVEKRAVTRPMAARVLARFEKDGADR